jgi:hypothetical protein
VETKKVITQVIRVGETNMEVETTTIGESKETEAIIGGDEVTGQVISYCSYADNYHI